jgi:hypothetical protein
VQQEDRMAIPRYLYHGTSARHYDAVLTKGLVPRGRRKSNWTHSVVSANDRIYLTDAYPIYFAFSATTPGVKEDGMVIEIDTDMMNAHRFVPDEDALEQSTRGRDQIPGSMKERTVRYRELAPMYSQFADESLYALGTCAYMGTVEPQHISRIAVIKHDKLVELSLRFDPTITITNYHFCGERYRESTQWLFDRRAGAFPEIDRDGIEIIQLMKEAA